MSSFEPNSVIRGFQLVIVANQYPYVFLRDLNQSFNINQTKEKAVRALRNPELFKHRHFHQAALAVAVGVVIHLIIQIPIVAIKFVVWLISLTSDLDHTIWDDKVTSGLDFVSKYVLQVPFLLMTLMGYITPTLDDIFMESLKWVDTTYVEKHKREDPRSLRAMYYPTMVMYPTSRKQEKVSTEKSKPVPKALKAFLRRYGQKIATLLGIYLASLLPVVGRFVAPAVSFYTFRKSVGTAPAGVIFGTGLVLPKMFLLTFLHTYFASRSLMRDLLEPYFRRIRFTPEQRRKWFSDREGVLFGFAFGWTIILKTPFIGQLMYGVAEAATAYLVTKITDPPPPPSESEGFSETQVTWKNKHEFLHLSLDNLDKPNLADREGGEKRDGIGFGTGTGSPYVGRRFN